MRPELRLSDADTGEHLPIDPLSRLLYHLGDAVQRIADRRLASCYRHRALQVEAFLIRSKSSCTR